MESEGWRGSVGSKGIRGAKDRDTVYDDILKAMLNHLPGLFIPLVNDVFGTDYPCGSPFEVMGTEHLNTWGKTYNDATFMIGGTIYHIECQSSTDGTMALRMLEYDLAIALERAASQGLWHLAKIPESCVVYLRHTKNTPDELWTVLMDNGHKPLVHRSRVVKVQAYSLDDIFQRRLILFFPFYLMRYNSNRIRKIANSDTLTRKLVAECRDALARFKGETIDLGEATLFHELISYTMQVVDHLFVGYDELRTKVREAMGANYIETVSQKSERLERERDEALAKNAELLAKSNELLAERDEALAENAELLAKSDELLAKSDELLAERDEALAKSDELLAERDEYKQKFLEIVDAMISELVRTKPGALSSLLTPQSLGDTGSRPSAQVERAIATS